MRAATPFAAPLAIAIVLATAPAPVLAQATPAPAMPAPAADAPAPGARGLVPPTPGAAAPVTPEGAQALQQELKTWLTETMRRQEEITVVFDGGLTVEPQGDLYQAVIPPARVTFGGDTEVVVDRIEIVLRPRANGWYDTSWTIPSRYDFVDRPDGQDQQPETATLTIGSQRASGVFAPEFRTFLTLDAALNNLVLTPPRNQGRLAMATVTATVDAEQTAPGVFDSTYDVRLNGLDFADTDSGARVRLGTIGMDGTVAAFRVVEYMAFAEDMAALRQAQAAVPADEVAPQLFQSLTELVDRTPRLLDGFAGQYWVSELQADIEGTRVGLGNGAFGMSLSGLEGAAASFGITLDVGGLAIQPPPPFAQFIPAVSQIDLALTGLPNEAVLETFRAFLQSAQQLGPDTALMMAGLQIQQAVMTAGSQLQVNALRLESDAATVDLTGVVSPAPASPLGVTARASLALRGFEAAIAELRQQPDSQQPIQALTLLQTMGTAATDAQGRPIRRYEIEVTPAGLVKMNGTDMAPLFDQFINPQPPSQPQSQPGRRG